MALGIREGQTVTCGRRTCPTTEDSEVGGAGGGAFLRASCRVGSAGGPCPLHLGAHCRPKALAPSSQEGASLRQVSSFSWLQCPHLCSNLQTPALVLPP